MEPKGNPPIGVGSIVKAITYLIALLGFLSVFRHIDALYSVSFLCLLLFSLYFEYRKRFFIPRWILNIFSLFVLILSFLRLGSADLVQTALEALIILTGIKFLEEKKFRDYMQIYLISILLLSGSSLITSDIVFLPYLLCLVFLLTLAMVMLTYHAEDPSLRLGRRAIIKILLKSLLIPAVAVPLTALMFVVLPRTNYTPLLGFLNRGEKAKTGFTDNVRLGTVSEIQEDASVIFRAGMEPVDAESLYWRGIVLDYFDGVGWKSLGRSDSEKATTLPVVKGKRIEQTIYLEAYENRNLFAVDKPLSVSMPGAKFNGDLTALAAKNIDRRIRYEAVSVLSDTIPGKMKNEAAYLQLPETVSPEITGLVGELSLNRDKKQTAEAILKYLRGGRYRYSLDNLPVTKQPVRDFLFTHKYGNCEYFASAMAVMLRVAGIPSRIVGGYRGGYYNDIGRYYAVPQKNAHVWVEAFIGDEGWLRLDPTPAPAGIFTSPYAGDSLFRMRLLFDTVNFFWNASVVNYDFKKQVSFWKGLRPGVRRQKMDLPFDGKLAVKYGTHFLLALSLIFGAYHLFFRRRPVEERLLGQFLGRMEKLGYMKKRSEGLEEFIARVEDSSVRDRARIFVKAFEEQYYRDKRFTKEVARDLKEAVRKL